MLTFRIVYFSVIALVWVLVHFSLMYLLKGDPKRRRKMALAGVLMAFFAFGRGLFRTAHFMEPDGWARGLADTYYFLLALFIYALFAVMIWALARRVTAIKTQAFDPSRRALLGKFSMGAALGVPSSLTMYGAANTRNVRLVENVVTISDLPAEMDGLRFLQITDLHVGQSIRKEFVEKVVAVCNSASADFCALTGDILDAPLGNIRQDALPLKDIKTKWGSYFVTGNHEYSWGADEFLSFMSEEIGATPLVEDARVLEIGGKRLLIGGASDVAAERRHPTHRSDPAKAIGARQADFKLLLVHRPESAEAAQKAGFQYMVCGHTHAGQFFPFNIFIYAFYRYVKGNYVHAGMPFYVSAGTGFWGPANRAGVAPEVTLHILRKS